MCHGGAGGRAQTAMQSASEEQGAHWIFAWDVFRFKDDGLAAECVGMRRPMFCSWDSRWCLPLMLGGYGWVRGFSHSISTRVSAADLRPSCRSFSGSTATRSRPATLASFPTATPSTNS